MHLGDKYTSYLTNTPAVREEISPTPAFNPYLGRNPCKENQRNSYFCSINEYDTSMFRLLWLYIALLLPALLTNAQELSRDTLPGNPLTLDGKPMTEKQIERYLKQARKDSIRAKDHDLTGDMASEGTTPRRLTDLIGSLCDLTSGSGDKGTPIILIQGYFDNYAM